MRLNLGSRDDVRSDYINLDTVPPARSIPRQPFLQGDLGNLDWAHTDNDVEEILALDVLQRFPAAQTETVLCNWLRKLKIGGIIKLSFPDLYVLADRLALDALPRNVAMALLFGAPNDQPASRTALDMRHAADLLVAFGCEIETMRYEGPMAYIEARKVGENHVGDTV